MCARHFLPTTAAALAECVGWPPATTPAVHPCHAPLPGSAALLFTCPPPLHSMLTCVLVREERRPCSRGEVVTATMHTRCHTAPATSTAPAPGAPPPSAGWRAPRPWRPPARAACEGGDAWHEHGHSF